MSHKPQPVKVSLTWSEARVAADAGVSRQLLALHDNRPDFYGFKDEPWATHIEAAGAEMAVAKYTNQFWIPYARRPGEVTADVGKDIQVRRRGRKGWNMLMHEADRNDHRFVLVVGNIPDYEICGYMIGSVGKSEKYWGDPYKTGRPCFWIPQEDLLPPEGLL